jgi:hypothetical protein
LPSDTPSVNRFDHATGAAARQGRFRNRRVFARKLAAVLFALCGIGGRGP